MKRIPRAVLTALPLLLVAGSVHLRVAETQDVPSPESTLNAVAVSATETHTLILRCAPPGGTHRDPVHACGVLDQFYGEINNIEPIRALCPSLHDPLWVVVWGSWKGRELEEAYEYANLCAASTVTRGVLDFM